MPVGNQSRQNLIPLEGWVLAIATLLIGQSVCRVGFDPFFIAIFGRLTIVDTYPTVFEQPCLNEFSFRFLRH